MAEKIETKDERSLILYAETVSVDQSGRLDPRKMNEVDHALLKRWNASGFLKSGRLKSSEIERLHRCGITVSHWVELSEEAWKAAQDERRARSKRSPLKEEWKA